MYYNFKQLPYELKKKILFKLCLRGFLCIGLIGISFLLFFVFNDIFFSALPSNYNMQLFLVFVAVIMYKTEVPKKLLDFTWTGRIVKISVETKKKAYRKFGGKGIGICTTNTIFLLIEQEKGKRVLYEAESLSMEDDRKINGEVPVGDISTIVGDYCIGERVVHFYGSKYLYFPDDIRKKICIICGTKNLYASKRCNICESVLISQEKRENNQ